jgi:hypothetical protein
MVGLLFLLLFVTPAAVLVWRIIVTKSRSSGLRIGAAGAAMATMVGAFVVYDRITNFTFGDWRDDLGLAAALSGSAYLLFWSLRRHANRRHRTVSLIAAVIGVVPAFGAVASMFLQEG